MHQSCSKFTKSKEKYRALNPGALNPGALNPGALNPGALNPGALNPGPVPCKQ